MDEDGRPLGPDGPAWNGRNKPHRGDRRWVQAWSPRQISERLRLDFPDDPTMRISHEAIYRALYVQGRGGLERKLVRSLRTGRALHVPLARTRQTTWAPVTAHVAWVWACDGLLRGDVFDLGPQAGRLTHALEARGAVAWVAAAGFGVLAWAVASGLVPLSRAPDPPADDDGAEEDDDEESEERSDEDVADEET